MHPWRTAIVNKDETHIWLRGYDITDLMRQAGFVDTVFLLHRGRLPSAAERRLLDAVLVASADHGPGAPSCATARLAASGNRESLSAAVAAGMLAIGDEHGGAGETCMKLIAAYALGAAAGTINGRGGRACGRSRFAKVAIACPASVIACTPPIRASPCCSTWPPRPVWRATASVHGRAPGRRGPPDQALADQHRRRGGRDSSTTCGFRPRPANSSSSLAGSPESRPRSRKNTRGRNPCGSEFPSSTTASRVREDRGQQWLNDRSRPMNSRSAPR